MPPRLVALLVTVAAIAGGVALTSCGAEDAAGVDAAHAAQATTARGTARVAMTMRMSGLGLPSPITMRATGVTALGKARERITMDFRQLLTLAGAPPSNQGDLEMIVDGADLYVKPPKLDGLSIPGGKPWVALDLRVLAKAAGLPTEGLGAFTALDPASQLRMLKSTKGLREVGKEDVDGAKTTHLKGTYRMSDVIARLPRAKRAQANKVLEALKRVNGVKAHLDDPTPAELWIGDDGLLRRMRMTSKLPSQSGGTPGSMVMDYSLRDFGAALDSTAPPASEIYDATEALRGALKGLAPAAK